MKKFIAFLTSSTSIHVSTQGPFGLLLNTPKTGILLTSCTPEVRSLSHATAITALGLFSKIIFLAKVPPVATNIFTFLFSFNLTKSPILHSPHCLQVFISVVTFNLQLLFCTQ